MKAPREKGIDSYFAETDGCRMCECRFGSAKEATKHYKEQHLNITYFCDMCEMSFSQSRELDIHYVTCGTKPIAPSEVPKPTTLSNCTTGSQNNRTNISSTRQDNCNTAKENCAAAPMLDDSEFIEFCEEYCLECEMDFANSREFAEHFDAEHDTFVCTICKIGYMDPALLKSHFAQKHSGDKYSTYYYGNELRKSFANQTETSTRFEHVINE